MCDLSNLKVGDTVKFYGGFQGVVSKISTKGLDETIVDFEGSDLDKDFNRGLGTIYHSKTGKYWNDTIETRTKNLSIDIKEIIPASTIEGVF